MPVWRARRHADHLLAPALLAAFAATTAVYWAHTSHKSVIDALLFVYAAGALAAWPRLATAWPRDDGGATS